MLSGEGGIAKSALAVGLAVDVANANAADGAVSGAGPLRWHGGPASTLLVCYEDHAGSVWRSRPQHGYRAGRAGRCLAWAGCGSATPAATRVNAQVRANTGHFARSLEECLPGNGPHRSGSPSIRRAIRVLNLAEINEDPIAKLVLAVSTIEGLAKDPPWSDEQRQLIENAAAGLERAHGDREEAQQVVEAVRQVWNGSIRQRIRKLLKANDLSSVWKDWDRLYERRSGFFHGRSEAGSEHLGSHLEQSSLQALGQEAITLCARIVLSMAQREGVAVPGRVKVHFGVD